MLLESFIFFIFLTGMTGRQTIAAHGITVLGALLSDSHMGFRGDEQRLGH